MFRNKCCGYLKRPPPPFLWRSWLFRLIWLLRGGEKWLGGRVGEVLKSSSISRTLAKRLLEGGSISFILLWICIVFRLNFSPGRDIRKSQGIHWRNITRTWNTIDLSAFLKRAVILYFHRLIWIWRYTHEKLFDLKPLIFVTGCLRYNSKMSL